MYSRAVSDFKMIVGFLCFVPRKNLNMALCEATSCLSDGTAKAIPEKAHRTVFTKQLPEAEAPGSFGLRAMMTVSAESNFPGVLTASS